MSPKGEICPADSFYNVDINDFYTQYYRMVYRDSTLINPNYILPQKKNNSIIFLMDISEFIDKNKYGFNYDDFIQVDKKVYILKEKANKKFKKE